jgi:chaperonin cofactor prefoldin
MSWDFDEQQAYQAQIDELELEKADLAEALVEQEEALAEINNAKEQAA